MENVENSNASDATLLSNIMERSEEIFTVKLELLNFSRGYKGDF